MSRRGSTLIEQLITVSMLALVAAISSSSASRVLDSAAVKAASWEACASFAQARDHALATGMATAVRIDPSRQMLIVHSHADTIARKSFHNSNVKLSSTRDSMSYNGSGLGSGAANLTLYLSRNQRSDTITVSRLGRVRCNQK